MKYSKPKNIFIVDDDPMLNEALTDYLTRNGEHKVTAFATGEDCLKCMDENPDVVVLDYFLNTIQKDAANGMEILEVIKKHYPKIHLIMLSSQERYGIAMQSVQKGAEQYVIKDETAFEKIALLLNES